MTSAIPSNDRLFFGELLEHLRQHGFAIGLDHYLRLQTLLDKIDGQCAPIDLRTLLCPIFATSRNQQEQFYRIFDSYFDLFESAPEITETGEVIEEAEAAPLLKRPPRRKWPYVLVPVAAAVAIIIVSLFLLRSRQAEQNASDQTGAQPTQQSGTSPAPTATENQPDATRNVESIPASVASTERQATPAPTPAQTFYQR